MKACTMVLSTVEYFLMAGCKTSQLMVLTGAG